jgi:hypothetical protein
MHESAIQLIKLLFRKGEGVCVSPNRFGHHSIPYENLFQEKVTLVSPNQDVPIETVDSSSLILSALNPISGFRRDANCTAYRNFLVEMDDFARTAQIEYLQRLGLVYSAMVWSGSKSVHTLISLSEDLPDESTYRMLYKWILSVVTLSDQALGNPSRSFRIPGAVRDTGNIQELIEFRGPVKLEELKKWLSKYPCPSSARIEIREVSEHPDPYRLSPWVRKQLRDGIDFTKRGRNSVWFSISCDFATAGYSVEETMDYLSGHFTPEHDFSQREWESAIQSAQKYILRK